VSGKASRDKGARGEREAAAVLSAVTGCDLERAARNGVDEAEDVMGLPGYHVEVKVYSLILPSHIRRWWAKLCAERIEGRIPLLMRKVDRQDWTIRIPIPGTTDPLVRWIEMSADTFGDLYQRSESRD
jgi:hypothetical protein